MIEEKLATCDFCHKPLGTGWHELGRRVVHPACTIEIWNRICQLIHPEMTDEEFDRWLESQASD